MRRHLFGLSLGVVALLLAGPDLACARQPAKSATPERTAPKIEALSVKAFKLKTREPNDVKHTMQSLLGELPGGGGLGYSFIGGPPALNFSGGGTGFSGRVGGGLPVGTFSGGNLGGALGGGLPGGGALGQIGGALGALGGGGLSGGGVMIGVMADWRTVVDPRTRVLLVRGSEKELQVASDLVTVLEAPDDKPLPTVKTLTAFRLKHAKADALVSVLTLQQPARLDMTFGEVIVLEPQVRLAAFSPAKMLIASGPDKALKQISEVVKELDVPSDPRGDGKLSTRAFRLKLCDPDEVKMALERLLKVEGEEDNENPLRIGVSQRTRSLLVRGTKRELDIAADLVAVLETPKGKALPKVKNIAAFALAHADAEELASEIHQLETPVRLIGMSLAKLLVAIGTKEDLDNVGDLVKQLDVVVKERGKDQEEKKLFRDGGGAGGGGSS